MRFKIMVTPWTHGMCQVLVRGLGDGRIGRQATTRKGAVVATIDRRVGKSGVVTWRVRWREGGTRAGKPDAETCDEAGVARDFAALVRLAGERRPEGYPRGCRGRRLLLAEPVEAPRVPTLAEVVEEYFATLVDVEPLTLKDYRRDFRTHVQPAVVVMPGGLVVGPLGGIPIDECADVDVWQAWVNHMRAKTYGKAKKHYSPKTIINIHGGIISPAFEFATARRGYCGANPCRWVTLPERKGRPVKDHHVLDIDEFQDWIDCAYEVDADTGDVTALILGSGIRWGEVTALRRCDVKINRDEEGEITGGRHLPPECGHLNLDLGVQGKMCPDGVEELSGGVQGRRGGVALGFVQDVQGCGGGSGDQSGHVAGVGAGCPSPG